MIWSASVLLLLAASTLNAQQFELVSVNSLGTGPGNNWSNVVQLNARVVAGDRFLAFASAANNLAAGVTGNVQNLYVRDLTTGTTVLATPDWQGQGGANDGSSLCELSGNGRYLAFLSDASNLVPNDTDGRRSLFLRDLQLNTTVQIKTAVPGIIGCRQQDSIHISDDGNKIAFSTDGYNLGLPFDRNRSEDVFVYDTPSGILTPVSLALGGNETGNGSSFINDISNDGRYVVFSSNARNLIADSGLFNNQNVYVRDLLTGTTKLVSVALNGRPSTGFNFTANQGAFVSADGRFVSFYAVCNNLLEAYTNFYPDIFQLDLWTGVTRIVLLNFACTTGGNQGIWEGFAASRDGRFVAFLSHSTDLVAGSSVGGNCFVRDMQTGVTRLASRNVPALMNGEDAAAVKISPDGRYVAFNVYHFGNGFNTQMFLDDATAKQTGQVGGPNADQTLGAMFLISSSDDSRFFLFYGDGALDPSNHNQVIDWYLLRLDSNKKGRRWEGFTIYE
jgi:Tol biopolymer transport system component